MALIAAHAIPHPSSDGREEQHSWIGDSDWEFSTALGALPDHHHEVIELVFHGVDTIARVDVDGVERARSINMHRTWRVPVPELAERDAHLLIHLASPIAAARAEHERLGDRWGAFSVLPSYIRKKACDFGWDWGPALYGSGIWRDVHVEAWSTARIAAVRPTARLAGASGVVELDIDIERSPQGRDAALEIDARIGSALVTLTAPAGVTRIRGELHVPDAPVWWPRGLGAQNLVDLDITLRGDDGALDHRSTRIGFRDLAIEQMPDADGSGIGFTITVNGERLFTRGFNWIPDDTSIAAVTEDDYRRRIADATSLGANLLRVWGGGVFESDAFYRVCDEEGVLVWQDFLFACAAYPEEDPFSTEVEAEARDNVNRLMHHPSLAIWNGNNENLWFWHLHGWGESLADTTWGEKFYFDILPSVVADLDPARTYIPGSPSSGGRWDEPNDPTRGVVHWWLPGDYLDYDQVRPRFVSEFGFQGPPTRPVFDVAVADEQPAPFSPGTVRRQKAEGGTERINDVLAAHFGVPADFDEWFWLAQLNQARAVRYGIERFRTLEPYCSGTVLWQLNDLWPSLSWSVVDWSGRWKPAAFAVREAFRDRMVTLRREDGQPSLFACNSTSEAWRAEIRVDRLRDGSIVSSSRHMVEVAPHSAVGVALVDASDIEASEALIATCTIEGEPRETRSVLLGATDREFPDTEPQYGVDVVHTDDGVAVRLTAHTFLRDVLLPVEELAPDARADRNLETLLPGESTTWLVSTDNASAFTDDAIRSVVRVAHRATVEDADYRGLAQLEAEKKARRAQEAVRS